MARVGRKRKMTARQPNGQPKRIAEDMTAVVKEARARIFNLSIDEAGSMPETSVLGRLRQHGARFERLAKMGGTQPYQGITQQQYDAGTEFLKVVMERRRMVGAKGVPSGGDLQKQAGHDDSDGTDRAYVDRYRSSLRRFNAAYAALNEACRVDPSCRSVVEFVCLGDMDVPSMEGALRLGLNSLARALGVGERGVDSDRGSWHGSQLMNAGS